MGKKIWRATIDYLKDLSELLSWATASIIRYNKDINTAKKWLTPTVSIWKWKIKVDFLLKNFKMDNWWFSATTKVENIECSYKINNDFWWFEILDFKPIKDKLVTSNQKTFENSVVWSGATKDSLIVWIPLDDLVFSIKPTFTENVKNLSNQKNVEKAWDSYHLINKAKKSKEQFLNDYIVSTCQSLNLYSEKIAFAISMLKMRKINNFWVELKILTPNSHITKEFN